LVQGKKRIDILVNNAGIVKDGMFMMANMEKWWHVVDVIFGGTITITKEVLFNMVSQKFGKIINITSVGGVIGIHGQTNYTSAKGAILSFTKSLAKEVARLGITINCISPGYVDTDMVQQYSEDAKSKFKEAIPMKRFASSEEIANVALFLASDLSNYITGQNIIVDGGMAS
jgi:NAD(P)-dependent dehydrogenase (short-subunit alcohol dehydrogenase family)